MSMRWLQLASQVWNFCFLKNFSLVCVQSSFHVIVGQKEYKTYFIWSNQIEMPKISHKSLLSYWKCIELVFACRSCVNLAQIASYFDASHEMGQDNKILFTVACKVALFGLASCTCGVNGIVTKWERLPHSSSRSLTHRSKRALYHFFFPALILCLQNLSHP